MTSICGPSITSSSSSIRKSAGVNRESVFTSAATYVPVPPSLKRIAFAASFTSESNPHPAIAT
jgi:hypothetical protein